MFEEVWDAVIHWGGLKEILIGTGAMILAYGLKRGWAWAKSPTALSEKAQDLIEYFQSEEVWQTAKSCGDASFDTKEFHVFISSKTAKDFLNTPTSGMNLLNSFSPVERKAIGKVTRKLCAALWKLKEAEVAQRRDQELEKALYPEAGEEGGEKKLPFGKRGS